MVKRKGETHTAILSTSDTMMMDFRRGVRVQCVVGALKGINGVVAASRSGGRILVRLADGVCLELPRICLRRLEPSRSTDLAG